MVSIAEIQKHAAEIGREFRQAKVILFGSYAAGEATPDSDVDLMVVMPFTGKSHKTATEIRLRVPAKLPRDVSVRSPEEIESAVALGDPFLREILERGLVLYEPLPT